MSLLQMSFSGAVLIAAIIFIRLVAINKLPKKTFLILWFIALFRLIVPVSIPSVFSVYSMFSRNVSSRTLHSAPVVTLMPVSEAAASRPASPVPDAAIPDVTAGHAVSVWTILWIAGAVICALYFLLSYIRCYREFRTSLPVRNDFTDQWLKTHALHRHLQVRYSDRITAPLTYGVLHPVILMPKKTDWTQTDHLQYVYAHEYIHIRRWDSLIKMFCIIAVCIHWFNPLVWIMYFLFNRDLEMNCDESVIYQMGEQSKRPYAQMLVTMQARRSGLMPLCNHFSKNAIEERTRAIMKTKKKSVATILTAALLVAGLTTACATSASRDGGSTNSSNAADSTADTATVDASDAIQPLYPLTSAEDAKADGGYSVYFTPGDLKEADGRNELTAEFFEYDRYEMDAIDNMKVGDKIQYCQDVIEVKSIDTSDSGYIVINGGIEQGGLELTEEDGLYRTISMDDYPVYYSVGTATLPISTDMTFEDHFDQEKEPDGVVYEGTDALDAIKNSETDFSAASTVITVRGEEIIQVIRYWVP